MRLVGERIRSEAEARMAVDGVGGGVGGGGEGILDEDAALMRRGTKRKERMRLMGNGGMVDHVQKQ